MLETECVRWVKDVSECLTTLISGTFYVVCVGGGKNVEGEAHRTWCWWGRQVPAL